MTKEIKQRIMDMAIVNCRDIIHLEKDCNMIDIVKEQYHRTEILDLYSEINKNSEQSITLKEIENEYFSHVDYISNGE